MWMEKYLAAAEKFLTLAIVTQPLTNGPVAKFKASQLESTGVGDTRDDGSRLLATIGEVYKRYTFPKPGDYVLRVRAAGEQAGPEPVRLTFKLDGRAQRTVEVAAVEGAAQTYECRVKAQPGERRVAVAFINDFYNPDDPNPDNQDRNAIV